MTNNWGHEPGLVEIIRKTDVGPDVGPAADPVTPDLRLARGRLTIELDRSEPECRCCYQRSKSRDHRGGSCDHRPVEVATLRVQATKRPDDDQGDRREQRGARDEHQNEEREQSAAASVTCPIPPSDHCPQV